MDKLLQDPNRFVSDIVDGLVRSHPDYYEKVEGVNVIKRKNGTPSGQVGLVSGGGSGHEPAHAGYVGEGMLSAAVCGEVFTSPTPDMVLEGIKAADGGAGVLLIVKNYSGDVMNFDMARELAELEGIQVETVIINDDIAIKNREDRRGVAGTVFVHKIAGAAAAAGKSLPEVKKAAEKAINHVRSIGMALSPCYMPESGKPGFELHENEMEIGIGIHGEKGIERKAAAPVSEIVTELLDRLTAEVADKRIALMVNGMGGTPVSELYLTYKYVSEQLEQKEYTIARSYTGNYMTSLEMHGFSITLLAVDDELLGYLDAPSKTIGFPVRSE
ncbi:dihydroxyacetone kinase subunit DhaK [Fictibacillus fluitans]|uniref:Dihydroxyacetone kinase subunit DhaK n=1 Tax=Fictibacillus fluitans TaxID=3058422 RepID=A0ABT8HZE2_9BACL|nr:dihydroxyacetone kinase subunit DhaK [Fictibacillus sp. NE201]MDN4526135.1 dihydroxyacetone kinase subunit DhaK [Fictibacillus sp. NE201]